MKFAVTDNDQAVQTGTQYKGSRARLPVVLLLLSGVLVASVTAYMSIAVVRDVVRPVRVLVTHMFASEEMRSAQFLTFTDTETQLSTLQGQYAMQTQEVADHLLSRDVHGAIDARVVRAMDGEYGVYVGDTMVATSSLPVLQVSISQDGRYLAYIEPNNSKAATIPPLQFWSFFSLRTQDWSLVLLDTETRTRVELGTGVAPVMVDSTHLLYANVDGMYVYDVASGIRMRVLEKQVTQVPITRLISPNRLVFGVYDSEQQAIRVYGLDSTLKQVTERGHVQVIGSVATYVLGDTGIYSLRIRDQKAEVWRQRYGASISSVAIVLPAETHPHLYSLGIF